MKQSCEKIFSLYCERIINFIHYFSKEKNLEDFSSQVRRELEAT